MEYMSNTNAVVVTKAIVSSAYVTNVMMVLEVWFTWLNKISIFRGKLRYNTFYRNVDDKSVSIDEHTLCNSLS